MIYDVLFQNCSDCHSSPWRRGGGVARAALLRPPGAAFLYTVYTIFIILVCSVHICTSVACLCGLGEGSLHCGSFSSFLNCTYDVYQFER